MRYPHDAFTEVQTLLVRIQHNEPGARELDEFQRGQSNRAGAEDEAPFAQPNGSAVGRVAADRERFYERELLEGKLLRDVQLVGRDREQRPKAAIAVDAEHLQRLAAVSQATRAGVALPAVQVRFDGTAVARSHVL